MGHNANDVVDRDNAEMADLGALILRADRLRATRRLVVARQVSLSAQAGQVAAIEGPNGSGKSTLLAASAGLLPTDPGSHRPASIGYAPERADVLPRMAVRQWLISLAYIAGLSGEESARQADDLLTRMGLADAANRSLRTLSRGNIQRALVAQALIGPPGLIGLDEPSGGLDPDGVSRLAVEIRAAAEQLSVVLVTRHPTAPVSLPAGPTWHIEHDKVLATERMADISPAMEVETGDGVIRQTNESELPAVLRAILDAGLTVRRVQAVEGIPTAPDAPDSVPRGHPAAASRKQPPHRTGVVRRIIHGARHRALLLATSQWFAAPALIFFAFLGIVYSTASGPPLESAALTTVALIPVIIWMSLLAHLVEGRLVARAFAAHIGGRRRAHLAACMSAMPFVIVAVAASWGYLAATQPLNQSLAGLFLQMLVLDVAAAIFAVGVSAVLVPPFVEHPGWRLFGAVGLFLFVLVLPISPMHPLLLLATHQASGVRIAEAVGALSGIGAVLIGLTTYLSAIIALSSRQRADPCGSHTKSSLGCTMILPLAGSRVWCWTLAVDRSRGRKPSARQ